MVHINQQLLRISLFVATKTNYSFAVMKSAHSYPAVSMDPSKNGIFVFQIRLVSGTIFEDLQVPVDRWKDFALQKVFCGKVIGRQT